MYVYIGMCICILERVDSSARDIAQLYSSYHKSNSIHQSKFFQGKIDMYYNGPNKTSIRKPSLDT